MLSRKNLTKFSRFIFHNTKLFLIPSEWDFLACQFKEPTLKHIIIERGILVLDVGFRLWSNFAYGYMIYWSLKDPTTTVRATLPILYVCALNWCTIIRLISHLFRIEIEQFVNSFVKLNQYLGEYSFNSGYFINFCIFGDLNWSFTCVALCLHMKEKNMSGQKLIKWVLLILDMTSVVCTICPVFVWSQNYLNANSYVFYFGLTPGRHFYTLFLVFWVFWNWKTFIYFVFMNFVSLFSMHLWLLEILWASKMQNCIE